MRQRLFSSDTRLVFHNDSTARAFVFEHCPVAAAAYDCLRPASYKADLWRYCVLYTHGGIYLDVEDLLLVPFSSLVRPCDSLLLVRDLCPEKDDRLAHAPCRMPAVQVSLSWRSSSITSTPPFYGGDSMTPPDDCLPGE